MPLGRANRVDEVHAAHSTQSLDSASSPGMHWDAAREGPWSQNSEQCPCRCASLSTAPLPLSWPPSNPHLSLPLLLYALQCCSSGDLDLQSRVMVMGANLGGGFSHPQKRSNHLRSLWFNRICRAVVRPTSSSCDALALSTKGSSK